MKEHDDAGLDPRQAAELDRLLGAMGVRMAEDRARRRSRRSSLRIGGVAVALAAGLGALLLAVLGPGERLGPLPDAAAASGWDVSADQSFAVFPTTDEDMVIIWILGEAR